MSIINPSQARKIFYQLLKDVNHSGEPVFISGDNEAVIISKKIGMRYKKHFICIHPE